MQLNKVKPAAGSKQPRKRVGRGIGCGLGKTAGRGHKGQKARAGGFHKVGFEGGQMPLHRRVPKRGFHNPFREEAFPINVGVLERHFQSGGVIDVVALRGVGLVPRKARIIKILAGGEVTAKLTVKAHRFSKSAVAKLEAAGGTAEVVALPGSHAAPAEAGA